MTTSKKSLVPQADFAEISALITAARLRAVQAVNTTLIDLYWQVGQTISRKIEQAQWARTQPGLRGFTRPNLFRMREFYLRMHELFAQSAAASELDQDTAA